MKRRQALMLAATAAVALGLLAWAFAPRPLEVELATASSGPFETTVDDDARTRLRERYSVQAPLAGRLERISWREGDTVAAGDVLARLAPVLSPMLDERTRSEQRARLGAADANRQRAAAAAAGARVALQQSRNELQRSEQLASQGFIGPAKLDVDRLAVQASQRALDAAVEAEHMAAYELQMARAALGAVQGASGTTGKVPSASAPAPAGADGSTPASRTSAGAPLDTRFVVRSPIAGRVLKVYVTSEATVPLGAPLLEIGDTSRLEIVAELLTTDALALQPGAAVRIERWGGPGTLEGRVRRVEPAAFTKISALGVEEQRVNVIVDIASPAAQWAALGDGYRVSLRIVTRHEPSVLRVPVSAVFPMPAGAEGGAGRGDGVFVFDQGRARLQPVVLGGRNGSHAWVREGLSVGAQVIVYPPAGVADGVRVRERKV